MQYAANNVDEMKRSSSHNCTNLRYVAQPFSQGTNYNGTFEDGFPHQIPRPITTLHIVPIMKEQRRGFSRVVFLENGRPPAHFSGFMVNVCSPLFPPMILSEGIDIQSWIREERDLVCGSLTISIGVTHVVC